MRSWEIISWTALAAHLSERKTRRVVRELVRVISDEMRRGGRITLTGLGTFRVKPTKPKRALHAETGRPFFIPASRKISFKPSSAFKAVAKASACRTGQNS